MEFETARVLSLEAEIYRHDSHKKHKKIHTQVFHYNTYQTWTQTFPKASHLQANKHGVFLVKSYSMLINFKARELGEWQRT
jgi:hypothetical protein